MKRCRELREFALIFMLLPALVYSISLSNTVDQVAYYIAYDPLSRTGYETITLQVSANGITDFSIQLINPLYGCNATLINATFANPDAVVVPPSFNSSTCEVDFVVNSSTTVTVYLLVTDLFQELAPGSYEGVLDFTMFRNASFTSIVTIPGVYQVIARRFDSPSGDPAVSYTSNTTVISFSSPGLYHVILMASGGEEVPQPTGSGGGGFVSASIVIWLIPVTVIAVLAVAILLLWRRRERVVVETLPPRSLEEDEIVKEIILALGDAGEKGLRQSDIVAATKRPKSSISRRVKRLLEEGYIEVERVGKYNVLKLTEKGLKFYRGLKKR
ncbi:MAG: MarR family transcriptional regulator [Thermogladius sp.]|nr:MarR family transcriptional regulator [Thermogladius sp.]